MHNWLSRIQVSEFLNNKLNIFLTNMAIIKKKYETFDVDYQKVIDGKSFDIVGQVVVRLADSKIDSLTISVYEDRRNSSVVASLTYSEVRDEYMESDVRVNCHLHVSATEEMMNHFSNDIVDEIKDELFGGEE